MKKEYNIKDIQELEAREHVRLKPQLYFDKCFKENNIDVLPFEVMCHALDEYLDHNCTQIDLSIQKDSFSVHYNAGMSLAQLKNHDISYAESIMTQIHACSNHKKHLTVGNEFCELGMATINFVAAECKLITQSNLQKGIFIFKEGQLISKKFETVLETNHYTEISMLPDKKIFKELSFTTVGINNSVQKLKKQFNQLIVNIKNQIT